MKKNQLQESDGKSLPKGWEIKKLGDVCLKTSNIKWLDANGKLYDYIDLSSVSRDNHSILEAAKVDQENAPSRAKKIIKEKDIIFATTRPTLKRLTIITENFDNQICSTGFTVLRPNSQKIISEFLFYSLLQDSFMVRMETLQRGASYPAVTDSDVKGFQIPLPPLSEQQRIVSILDKAFSAIERSRNNAEQNLKNAKELFENYLQRVFENGNWDKKNLNEITEVKDGTHDSPKYIKEGIPFVTQKNIKPDGLTLADTKFITEEDHEKFFKRSNVTFGDILISMIGANRGMAAIVDDKVIFSIKNVGLIKSSANVNMDFLLYYLKSPNAKKYVADMSNGGAQEFVGLRALRGFPIPLPSLDNQHVIVLKLNDLRTETQKLEAVYQKKMDD